jgi:hypothetical protein
MLMRLAKVRWGPWLRRCARCGLVCGCAHEGKPGIVGNAKSFVEALKLGSGCATRVIARIAGSFPILTRQFGVPSLICRYGSQVERMHKEAPFDRE